MKAKKAVEEVVAPKKVILAPSSVTRELAIQRLQNAGIEVHAENKVILWSDRPIGLKLLRFTDCLKNRHHFNQLNKTATESYLKAQRMNTRRKGGDES